jgi:hypothetical protein
VLVVHGSVWFKKILQAMLPWLEMLSDRPPLLMSAQDRFFRLFFFPDVSAIQWLEGS